jgi:homogentisate solanesyltransferase
VYYAARAAMGLPFVWSPTILFITAFVSTFATVIAIAKDLPDIEGDRANGIKSFAVTHGAEKISYVTSGLLLLLYVGAAAAPFIWPGVFRTWLMTPVHAVVSTLVVRATLRLRAAKWAQAGLKKYYKFIWSIFYFEYAIVAFLAPL